MSKVALLTECKPYDPDKSFEDCLISVGGNTGNNTYVTALKDIFGAWYVDYLQLNGTLENDEFDTYIVGNLSWILENNPIPDFYYNAFKKITKRGKKFVPISVGTQAFEYKPDFKYHPTALSFFNEIAEQAVIACRGEYTAEMLNKNGVRNIEVVGCPSLFHTKNKDFKLFKKSNLPDNPKVATGITIWRKEDVSLDIGKRFLEYAINNNLDFIEQGNTNWVEFIARTYEGFGDILENYLSKHSKIYFDIEEWRRYSRNLDFSFGGRFHGNVIPLLEGVPALFITIDARMKEMCEYFKLPMMDFRGFNFNASIDELYEKADYSEFNKAYEKLYVKFEEYALKNGLKIV